MGIHYFPLLLASNPNNENNTGIPTGTKGTLNSEITLPVMAERLV